MNTVAADQEPVVLAQSDGRVIEARKILDAARTATRQPELAPRLPHRPHALRNHPDPGGDRRVRPALLDLGFRVEARERGDRLFDFFGGNDVRGHFDDDLARSAAKVKPLRRS
jgi:hypothetical protein